MWFYLCLWSSGIFRHVNVFPLNIGVGDCSRTVQRPKRESEGADRLTSNPMPCVADAKKSPISRNTISQGPEFQQPFRLEDDAWYTGRAWASVLGIQSD